MWKAICTQTWLSRSQRTPRPPMGSDCSPSPQAWRVPSSSFRHSGYTEISESFYGPDLSEKSLRTTCTLATLVQATTWMTAQALLVSLLSSLLSSLPHVTLKNNLFKMWTKGLQVRLWEVILPRDRIQHTWYKTRVITTKAWTGWAGSADTLSGRILETCLTPRRWPDYGDTNYTWRDLTNITGLNWGLAYFGGVMRTECHAQGPVGKDNLVATLPTFG